MNRSQLLEAMNANKPAPRPLTTTEQSAAAGSKYARPDVARQAAAVAPQPSAVTEKQSNFLRKLLTERVGITEAEDIRNALNQARSAKTLDKGMASEFITRLLAIKPNSVVRQAPISSGLPGQDGTPPLAKSDDAWKRPDCVPDGQYALRGEDGIIRFYSVNTNDGICWVAVHASDERHNIKGRSRHQILDAIAADPRSAAILFGHETNHCGRCGRELTDEVSRANGIGPVCARKVGWA